MYGHIFRSLDHRYWIYILDPRKEGACQKLPLACERAAHLGIPVPQENEAFELLFSCPVSPSTVAKIDPDGIHAVETREITPKGKLNITFTSLVTV